MNTYSFVYYHKLMVSGLIVAEDIPIEGTVTYIYTPGHPETGPTWDCGGQPADPAEIEIIEIRVFGHDPARLEDESYHGEERHLADTDPLWEKIAPWLDEHQHDEMCCEAEEKDMGHDHNDWCSRCSED